MDTSHEQRKRNQTYQRRRRFSREFKAEIVAQCQAPGASVSRISLDNGLNANMVPGTINEPEWAPRFEINIE